MERLTRRAVCVLMATTPLAGRAAGPYPDQPVRLVVPFPPGGGADSIARGIVAKASQLLGQNIIVLNKPGAGGNVGAAEVARSAPDGYTLLYGHNGTHGINPALYEKTGYDPLKDFVPIARFTRVPFMLVAHPSVPATTVKEFVTYLKSQPGKLNFASAGNGLTSHLAGVMFRNGTASDFVIVPYKGAGPALSALLAGEAQFTIDSVINVTPQIRAGKLKALAVMSAQRVPMVPDVPTIAEAGLSNLEIEGSDGVYAPTGTPRAIVERLNSVFRASLTDKETNDNLTSRGVYPVPGSPEDLAKHIATEYPMWGRLVKDSGAKIE